jgi:Flp pilus assembly pilin Flp
MVAFTLCSRRQQSGQGMTEYAIVAAALAVGAITTNSLIIPALNDLYELMTCMLSIPFP